MADFCGLWYSASAKTRADIVRDFEPTLAQVEAGLERGAFVKMGICEGHGAGILVFRDDEGLWFIHVPLGRKRRGTPDPVRLPPGDDP